MGELTDEDQAAIFRYVREERRASLMNRHPYEWDRPWTGWWQTDGWGLQRWGGKSAKDGLARLGYDWTKPVGSLIKSLGD